MGFMDSIFGEKNPTSFAQVAGDPLLGYKIRAPYPGEDAFFKNNPGVAGMAAEDNNITMNPYSTLSKSQLDTVAQNEAMRIWMRQNQIKPNFNVTPEQQSFFSGSEYGKPENINYLRQTILARYLTGDSSAGLITPEQRAYAEALLGLLPR